MTSKKKSAKRAPPVIKASTIKVFHLPDETLEAIMRYLPRQSLAAMTLVSRRFYPVATSLYHEHIAFFDYKLAKALVKAHRLHEETKCKILAQCTSNLALHEDLHLTASERGSAVELQTFLDVIRACNGGHVRTLMLGFSFVQGISRHVCYVKAIEKAKILPTKVTLLRCKFPIVAMLLSHLGKTLESLHIRDVPFGNQICPTYVPYAKLLRNLVTLELSTENLMPQAGASGLLKAVAPQSKRLILFGPLMSFQQDTWSPLVLSSCSFSELRTLECHGIPFRSYIAVIGSTPKLQNLQLAYVMEAEGSVLRTVPVSIHLLKYEGVSAQHDPPSILFDNIVRLKNLKRLPDMKYEPVPARGADVGMRRALLPIRAKLLKHFDKMGIVSTKAEVEAFLPYRTYGGEDVESQEIAQEPVKSTGRRSWRDKL